MEVIQHVKKDEVLCIIEAMKLMNEITSEYDGESECLRGKRQAGPIWRTIVRAKDDLD